MKYWGKLQTKIQRRIRTGLAALSVTALSVPMTLLAGQTAFAAEGYTYTVRLLAGNQGTLTGEGIEAPGAEKSNITDSEGNVVGIEISGLAYESRVNIIASEAAAEKDGRYYVRGVKRAGRDNSEEEPSFTVDCDKDYVISYGVRGDTVQYAVNYVDADGNELLAGGTYYGNSGERQYVSARYVDGYQPQAYNLVKTLSDNEAENVFNFVYTPVTAPADETGTATATPGGEAGAGAGTAAGAGAAAGADAGAAAGNADVGAAAAPEGDVVPVEDEQTPQDLVDLDDEQTPLANKSLDDMERPGGTRMGYLPVYAGIGAAAAAALLLAAIYLKKRRKPATTVEIGNVQEVLDDIQEIRNSHNDE